MQKNKVAIIGHGYVGQAYSKVFPDALCYQPSYFEREDELGYVLSVKGMAAVEQGFVVADRKTINEECGLAIVSVPTPMVESEDEFKKVDLSMIEEVVGWLETDLILLKSTVPPGTVDRLVAETGKKIGFSPEYVGEGKYQITPWKYMSPNDPLTHEFQIFGAAPGVRDLICNYFVNRLGPEKTYYLIDAKEAEIIKYMENCWGGMKVIFAQEFYDLCTKLGASYHRVREGWALDNRVEKMHTAVFVDNRGFAGKCYPKDLNGIVAAADDVGVDLSLVKAVLRKNNVIKANENE